LTIGDRGKKIAMDRKKSSLFIWFAARTADPGRPAVDGILFD